MSKFNEASRNRLSGKVVLLVANDAEALQAMTLSLAEKGADIAALCNEVPMRTLNWLQKAVETMGQEFYTLSPSRRQGDDAVDTISRLTSHFGQLDVLIDLSAAAPIKVIGGNEFRPSFVRPERDWRLIRAALREMLTT